VWYGSKLQGFRAFRVTELWIRGCGPLLVESYFCCYGSIYFGHLFLAVVTCSSLFLTHFWSSPLDCLSTDDGFWYIPLKCHFFYHHPPIQKQFSILFYFYSNDDFHLPYRKSISTVKNFKLIYLIPVLKGSTDYSSYLLDAFRKRACVCVCVYIYTHTHTSISVCVFFWGGGGGKRAAGAGFPFILPFLMQVDPVLHRFRLLVLQKLFTKMCPVNLFVPLV